MRFLDLLARQLRERRRRRSLEVRLFVAAYDGDAQTVNDLIKAGARVNCRDDLSDTPLHHAILGGSMEAFDYGKTPALFFLLDHGCDLVAINKDGMTPMEVAKMGDQLHTVAAIQAHLARQAIARTRAPCGSVRALV